MRSYWLRILLGALGVFAVGMLVAKGISLGKDEVAEIAEGTDPITLPLAFVPFKLDGERAGSIDKVKIFRDAPKQVSRVVLTVDLADSLDPASLDRCVLIAEKVANIDEHSTFRCGAAADTAGRDLVPFIALQLRQREGEELNVLAPRAEVDEFREHGHGEVPADPVVNVDVDVDPEAVANMDEATRDAYVDSIVAHAESIATQAARETERAGRAVRVR